MAFSGVVHIPKDNLLFLSTLCESRQIPDKPRTAPTVMMGPDGKMIKIPKPCKNRECKMRDEKLYKLSAQATALREKIIGLGKEMVKLQESKVTAEAELAEQQKAMAEQDEALKDAVLQEEEVEAELKETKAAAFEKEQQATDLELEKQRIGRIIFDNKLRIQGIAVDSLGDGKQLVPPVVGESPHGSRSHAEKTDLGLDDEEIADESLWCHMEVACLSYHHRTTLKTQLGDTVSSARRPKSSPGSAFHGASLSQGLFKAQARLLPPVTLGQARRPSTGAFG